MPANSKLQKSLTRLQLRRLAGAKAFELGSEYFFAYRVLDLSEDRGKVTGIVRGTTDYDVALFAEGDALAFDCTCPMGAEGGFCKHCVALGLAWLSREHDDGYPIRQTPAAKSTMTPVEVRAWLEKREKRALIEIILSRAAEDARFRNHLLLHIANNEHKAQ